MQSPFHQNATPSIFEKARALKRNLTAAEKVLWESLRTKKLGGYKFRRQHPADIFILDFYCHEKRLAVEVDGGVHQLDENKEYDAGRTSELAQMGIKVIRFTNEQVLKNLPQVLTEIDRHLFLNPSPGGRGTEREALQG